MTAVIYGVRRAAPFNRVVEADDREDAAEMLLPGDVIVTSRDGGRTWKPENEEADRA